MASSDKKKIKLSELFQNHNQLKGTHFSKNLYSSILFLHEDYNESFFDEIEVDIPCVILRNHWKRLELIPIRNSNFWFLQDKNIEIIEIFNP